MYKIQRVCLLLVLFHLQQSLQQDSQTGETGTNSKPFPTVTYTCVNGRLSSIDANNAYIHIDIKADRHSLCLYLDEICNQTLPKLSEAIIIVQPKALTNDQHTNVITNTSKSFHLKCTTLFTKSAVADAIPISNSLEPPTIAPKSSKEPELKLEVLKSDVKLNERVTVGEHLVLKMFVAGADSLTITPTLCKAYPNTSKIQSDGHEIWKYITPNGDDACSLFDKDIAAKKWKISDKAVTLDILAFRFVSTTQVVIECQAEICTTESNSCTKTCVEGRRRKRRHSAILTNHAENDKLKTASTSFTVLLDQDLGRNNSLGMYGSRVLICLGVLLIKVTTVYIGV